MALSDDLDRIADDLSNERALGFTTVRDVLSALFAEPDPAVERLLDRPLPDGWKVEGAIVLLRATDPLGQRRTTVRYAGDVMAWEAAGMLEVARHDVLAHVPAEDTILIRDA